MNPWQQARIRREARERSEAFNREEAKAAQARVTARREQREEMWKAQTAMAPEWGRAEYGVNIRAINRHLDNLPAAQREHYERGTTPDGRRLLNDPDTLRKLAADARKSPPVLIEAAQKHGGSERRALEVMMKDHGSPYWKGEESELLRARYRDILRESST